jgi:AmmeMemoRadiSam system protein A
VEPHLKANEKKLLLQIARDAITSYVTSSKTPDKDYETKALQTHAGCFVTIKKNGDLRGCIGNFISDIPLYKLVREMAVAAATKDPRFYPMKNSDLQEFTLEISVLSPLHKISSVEEITIGTHGLYIEKNFSRGVLLPQVAVEHGWDKETFLAQTCVKAGLRPDDWKESMEIFAFSAQIFSE